MDSKQIIQLIVFILYLVFMLAIGVIFFIRGNKSKNEGEKTYFLGGRKMGAWVAALSAGSSDMSAWLLLGLPASIFALGIGQVWIAVGLAIGYAMSWLFEASRLRRFSIIANDSITIPQYLTNRFMSSSNALRIVSAVVFLLAYTVYAATSVKACGTLFQSVLGIDPKISMIIAAVIIVSYTFLGGFSAVCWTDFFQSLLILGALFLVPIIALFTFNGNFQALGFSDKAIESINAYNALQTDPAKQLILADTVKASVDNYWSIGSPVEIINGLAWGIGYFGMPHIIIRFMSLKSDKELKKSSKIGISWTVLTLIFAVAIGIIGRFGIGFDASLWKNETLFIDLVKTLPAVISGLFLSAILAASMSTADSQLLAASSAFTSDVYQPLIRKGKASDKNMIWVGRIIVLIITVIALVIALNPGAGTIMSLVGNAWGVFGASFGPVIMLSLFWKRFNYAGAIAGIVAGACIDILYLVLETTDVLTTGLYEIVPGAVVGLIAAIVVTLATKKPSKDVEELFDKAVAYKD